MPSRVQEDISEVSTVPDVQGSAPPPKVNGVIAVIKPRNEKSLYDVLKN